jgi:hypothetical protein
MRQVKFATVLLSTVFAVGCLSQVRTAQVVDEGLQAHKEIPLSIYGAARSVPNADQGVIDMYEGGFKQRMDAQAGRIAELRQQVGDEENARKELLLRVARVAAAAVGFSLPGGTFEEVLSGALGQIEEKAEKKANAVRDSLGDKVATLVTGLAAVNSDLSALKTAFEIANQVASGVESVENQAAEEARKREAEREKWLTEQLSKLEGFDPAKFEANLKQQQELIAGKAGAELKQTILAEAKDAGIPKEMLDQLQGMSASEITTLVGTGGGAGLLGLLALLRSFGPSRSQRQTDVLNQLFTSLKEEVERMRGGQVVGNAPRTNPPAAGSEGSTT